MILSKYRKTFVRFSRGVILGDTATLKRFMKKKLSVKAGYYDDDPQLILGNNYSIPRLLIAHNQQLEMDILSLCQKHKHSRPPSSSLLHIHIQCLQVAMYDTWRRIMRLSLLLRSLLTDNPTSPKKMGHTTGVNDPTLFEKWCGFFYVPQKPDKRKCCERGPRVFRPLARRLESLPVCRCHKKGSPFFSVI